MNDQTVPQPVIEALLEVQQSGQTNMFDRRMVIKLADFYGHHEAAQWLRSNKDRYGAALEAFGNWLHNADTQF